MKPIFRSALLCLLAAAFPAPTFAAVSPPITGEPNRPRSREILLESLRFSDRFWDEPMGLIRSPLAGDPGRHLVRESSWYALGLLLRGEPGDDLRALRIIDEILRRQLRAPGQPWDGTFVRAPEEAAPRPGAVLWKNFDPNWRQFIGTTFALMLEEFSPRLPDALRVRMSDSIRRAVEGELTQSRAEPYHTNIALLHGFLWSWAGRHLDRPDWIAGGEAWAEKVHADYAKHQSFEEYNSPTYYGVDLYGLALWRRYGATEKIRAYGAEMEAGLWLDIARFYHAGLKNLCGPYDRAYGMDQRRYVSLVGVWMSLALEKSIAPLPDPGGPMDHAHDFVCAPTYVLLGANIPAEALATFRTFQGERLLSRPITEKRLATAWLSSPLMLGGELTQLSVAAGPTLGQFHPATAHWRIGSDTLGWFVLRECPPVDARAETNRLTIVTARGDSTFRIRAPGLAADKLGAHRWSLPNLEVRVETDASGFTVARGDGFVDARYLGATKIVLHTTVNP